ncbi:MAG: hypothetical protein ACK4K4_01305 [Caldimicrobium sp.]
MPLKVSKFFLFFIVLAFLLGCALKEVPYREIYAYLDEKGLTERTITGKVFVEGEIFFLDNIKQGGAYGTFFLNKDSYLLILRPPLASEYYLYWKRGEATLQFIDLAKKKLYYIKIKDHIAENLPLFFLGLKEKELSFEKKALKGKYTFNRETLKGEIETNLFHLTWKIKELSYWEGEFPSFERENFKKKTIDLFF